VDCGGAPSRQTHELTLRVLCLYRRSLQRGEALCGQVPHHQDLGLQHAHPLLQHRGARRAQCVVLGLGAYAALSLQLEIHTDPKACEYVIVRGAEQKTEARSTLVCACLHR